MWLGIVAPASIPESGGRVTASEVQSRPQLHMVFTGTVHKARPTKGNKTPCITPQPQPGCSLSLFPNLSASIHRLTPEKQVRGVYFFLRYHFKSVLSEENIPRKKSQKFCQTKLCLRRNARGALSS